MSKHWRSHRPPAHRPPAYGSTHPAIVAHIAPGSRTFTRALPILAAALGGCALGDRLEGFPGLAIADALVALEREFAIDLDPDEAYDQVTIAGLLDLVEEKAAWAAGDAIVYDFDTRERRSPARLKTGPRQDQPLGGPPGPFAIPEPPWRDAARRRSRLEAAPAEPPVTWLKPRLSRSLRGFRLRVRKLADAIFPASWS